MDFAATKERDHAIREMFIAGAVQQAIGSKFGITESRVCQILKRDGVSRNDGGGLLNARRRAAQTAARRAAVLDEKALREFGCTHAQLQTLRAMGRGKRCPITAFFEQRLNAKNRGVPWNLTLWQWWGIWRDSGKWGVRGKSGNGHCMGRYFDVGTYEVGNVYICTIGRNIRDYHAMRNWQKTLSGNISRC